MTLSTELARLAEAATRHENNVEKLIEGERALNGALRDNLPAIIAALKAAETPLGDVAGLVELGRWGVRWDGPDNPICEEIPDGYWTPWHLAADAITALTRQLAEVQQHAEALAGGMDRAITFIEALADNDLDEPIADNGMTVGAKLQMDAPPLIFKLRAALAAYRSVAGRALERGEG